MGAEVSQPTPQSEELRLGAWLTRTFGTIYQAATDGFVCAQALADGSDRYIRGYTDSATPPSVKRNCNGYSATDGEMGICFPVKENDYWKVTEDTPLAAYLFWIPLEP